MKPTKELEKGEAIELRAPILRKYIGKELIFTIDKGYDNVIEVVDEIAFVVGREAYLTNQGDWLCFGGKEVHILQAHEFPKPIMIEVTKDQLQFLQELQERFKTQDNRITSHCYYQVRYKERMYGFDKIYSEDYVWTDPDMEEQYDNTVEGLKDIYEVIREDCYDRDTPFDDDEGELVEYRKFLEDEYYRSDIMNHYGYTKVGWNEVVKVDQSFLTEQAAFDYINSRHRLGPTAFTYGESAHSNPEIKSLQQFIQTIKLP